MGSEGRSLFCFSCSWPDLLLAGYIKTPVVKTNCENQLHMYYENKSFSKCQELFGIKLHLNSRCTGQLLVHSEEFLYSYYASASRPEACGIQSMGGKLTCSKMFYAHRQRIFSHSWWDHIDPAIWILLISVVSLIKYLRKHSKIVKDTHLERYSSSYTQVGKWLTLLKNSRQMII